MQNQKFSCSCTAFIWKPFFYALIYSAQRKSLFAQRNDSLFSLKTESRRIFFKSFNCVSFFISSLTVVLQLKGMWEKLASTKGVPFRRVTPCCDRGAVRYESKAEMDCITNDLFSRGNIRSEFHYKVLSLVPSRLRSRAPFLTLQAILICIIPGSVRTVAKN